MNIDSLFDVVEQDFPLGANMWVSVAVEPARCYCPNQCPLFNVKSARNKFDKLSHDTQRKGSNLYRPEVRRVKGLVTYIYERAFSSSMSIERPGDTGEITEKIRDTTGGIEVINPETGPGDPSRQAQLTSDEKCQSVLLVLEFLNVQREKEILRQRI